MASSLTPNLGLSVWESEDTLTMEEFNRDHEALEQRLGYLAAYTLLDTSISQSASTISVNVDTSLWEDFDYIFVDWELPTNKHSYFTGMRLNGSNSDDQTYSAFYNDFRETYYGSAYVVFNDYSDIGRARFNVRRNLSHRISVAMESDHVYSWGTHSNLTYAQLTSLAFVCSHSSQTFNSGGHVKIWGVK